TAPVFAGDTIYAESEVIGKRESNSRPHHGIVTVRTTGKKADGTVFMTFERSAVIPMRGQAVDDRLDYYRAPLCRPAFLRRGAGKRAGRRRGAVRDRLACRGRGRLPQGLAPLDRGGERRT